MFPLARFLNPPVKDKICLAREEIMGYVLHGIVCRTTSIDNVIVFATFLAVRSPPQRSSPFSEGWYRTGILPIAFQVWLLYGEFDNNLPLPYEIDTFQPSHSGFWSNNLTTGKQCCKLRSFMSLKRVLVVRTQFDSSSGHQVSHVPITAAIKPHFFPSSHSWCPR
jgi:hypothetical protein